MESAAKSAKKAKGQAKERPLFMQNGNGNGAAMAAKDDEIKEFRRACPQFLAVTVKNTLLFVYGMTLGFPTIVIPAIQGGEGREPSDIVLNRDEISWFSSINLICVPLGCLFSGAFSHPIGKRRSMQLVNIPILGSWLMFHFATCTEHLYAALCMAGISGGLMEAPVLTFVAEITEPKYRGTLSATGSTCVISGVFMQFIMGSFMDWRTIAAINTAFPVLSIIALFFIPESPTWLIRKGKYREAVRALQWLRGWVPEYRVEAEFNTLYHQLVTQPALDEADEGITEKTKNKLSYRLRMFRKQSFWLPFLLISFAFFVGHFSGKTALQTYAVQIFHALKAPINKFHATILLGVAELVATVLSVCLIHCTGKRPLVIVSTIGCGCCFFGAATYAYFLNVIPGFAIDNVVLNASLLVPKQDLINADNITNIFESQSNPMLASPENMTEMFGYDITTLLPELFDDSYDADYDNDTLSRRKRSNDSAYSDVDGFNPFDDLPVFDYGDTNETEIESTEETTTMPIVVEEQDSSAKMSDLPSKQEVTNNILLPVPKQDRNDLVWMPLLLLLGAAFFAHIGIRMIPWILIGEVFPASVRSTASGLVGAVGYIFGFLANKLFLQMLATMTMPGTFWFYSAVAILGAVVLYYLLPETENKPLAEIESYFSKKARKARKLELMYVQSMPSFVCDVENNCKSPDATPVQKSIQLQQSDLIVPRVPDAGGVANQGFEKTEGNTTTHL